MSKKILKQFILAGVVTTYETGMKKSDAYAISLHAQHKNQRRVSVRWIGFL